MDRHRFNSLHKHEYKKGKVAKKHLFRKENYDEPKKSDLDVVHEKGPFDVSPPPSEVDDEPILKRIFN